MYRTVIATMGLAVIAGGLGIPQAAADNPVCIPNVCSFYSPTHSIDCEIDYQRGDGITDAAYCQTEAPPQSIRMSTDGTFKTCSGVSCLGNSGQDTGTLAYGQSATLGPFSCRSEVGGVTCTVTSGRGFSVSREGVKPVG